MNISLEKNEIDFVMNVLGELPTKSNAFVVLQKIVTQVQAQATSEETKSE
jgi:hypothetical protein